MINVIIIIFVGWCSNEYWDGCGVGWEVEEGGVEYE